MITTDNLYDPACTSNRARMGSLAPAMSNGVILLEAVMPTSHSQGAAGIYSRKGWLEQPYHQQCTWSHL